MRDLVEDLVRNRINGFDVWFDIYSRSSPSFSPAGALFDICRIRRCPCELLHQIMQRGRCACGDFLRDLTLWQRPAREAWSTSCAIWHFLGLDIGWPCIWNWRGVKEVLPIVEEIEAPSSDFEIALESRWSSSSSWDMSASRTSRVGAW